MTTATVTRRLQAEGLPVELVRGKGYHYFTWDDGTHFETASEMVFHFRDLTVDQWVERGRDFAAKVRAEIADRAEYVAELAAEKAAREAKPVVARMARYEAAYKALHGRTVSVTWSGEKVRVHCHGQNPAYDAMFTPDQLDEISERMEAKVAEAAARRDAPAEPDSLDALFGAVEAAAIAEANTPERLAEDRAEAARRDERNAGVDIFDVPETDDEEPDDDEGDDEADFDEGESR